MKDSLKKIIYNPLFSGSAVMIVGSNIVNAINYLYHVIVGRALGPSDYGELAALLSLMGLIGIIPFSFGLVIIKFISSAKGEKEIKGLFQWFYNRVLMTSIIIAGFIAVFSPFLGQFLKIENNLLIIIVGLTFLFSLPAFLNRSVLQGVLRFNQMVVSLLIENAGKLIFGVFLIWLGFSVLGATIGLLLSAILGFWVTRNYLKDYFVNVNGVTPDTKAILLFSFPVLIQSISNTSLYSSDLILVKHFFSSYDAGLYAALSNLGRIILFGSGPIAAVMFPVVSKRRAQGQKYHDIFTISLILTLVVSSVVLLFYYFYPDIAIGTLYGSSYLSGASYLALYGLFIMLFTLSSLFINYYLSLGDTKVVYFSATAAIVQVLGIWRYHSNINEVIYVSLSVTSLLLLCLFVYFLYGQKLLKGFPTKV